MRLSLFSHPEGVAVQGRGRVAYDVEAGSAHLPPATIDGPALVWELAEGPTPAAGALLCAEVALDGGPAGWLMRCDRVEFEPGGVAYRHTHPGPGIRCLLYGAITIETEATTMTYAPGEAWFERGPEPVLATTAENEPSAFARVLLLPERFAGQRTIRYVDPADAERPRRQKATILLEQPLA